MGEETVNKAIEVGSLKEVACTTKNIPIHGCVQTSANGHFTVYGTDAEKIQQLIADDPLSGKALTDELPYTEAEVIWATRYEMARTVEDVLARRLRILFLNARAALRAAPKVARLMAKELNYDEAWEKAQLKEFGNLAKTYLC
jgi:glycerol-3-phosphate dehydrogenase